MAHYLSEENESLLVMVGGPTTWAAHFLLSYTTAAIWCAKVVGPGGSLATVRLAIFCYTLAALVVVGSIGWLGYRRHSFGQAALPHDYGTPEDRHRFLGFAAFLLSALSAVAIIYEALVIVFYRPVLLMRRVILSLGFLTLAAAWLGPLPAMAREAFFAHMTMHMAVVAVAAPLLALAAGGSPFDPARKAPQWFAPIQASIVELVVVWAWHAPALHHAARHHSAVFIAEQGMFLIAGLFLWLSAFGGDDFDTKKRSAAGIVGLLFTAMHMTLLGALLALAPRPLYAHLNEPAELTALAPLDDQHLGGAIMLLVGGISYLTGGLWLTMRLLRDPSFALLRRS